MINNESTQKELFAAANSGKGFANFYSQVFGREDLEWRYLIKGGPGTGKSSFMKSVSRAAEKSGLAVEYYRCSSDPASLDGVIIGGRLALMDATSPHCFDPQAAGARDNLVDLGQFWNEEQLHLKATEIKAFSEQKSQRYRTAYELLGSAMQLDDSARRQSRAFIDTEKMKKAAVRIAKKLPDGKGYELRTGVCNSLGMKGRVRLDTYERLAEKVYYVLDFWHSGSVFLSLIANEAVKKNCKISVSYLPLNPTHPDAVYFEDSKTAFVLCSDKASAEMKSGEKKHIYINMKRFVNFELLGWDKKQIKIVKNEYKTAVRFCEALTDCAAEVLKNAGDAHFALEQIYIDAMDFEALTAFTVDFTAKVLDKLR